MTRIERIFAETALSALICRIRYKGLIVYNKMKHERGTRNMKKLLVALAACLLISFPFAFQFHAQTTADPALAAEIARIKAIDNHAHPMRVVNVGEGDIEWDALPFEGYDFSSPLSFPVRLRPDNPEYIGAWRALYRFTAKDAKNVCTPPYFPLCSLRLCGSS
ncbi:MAG: hypothetical protein HY314_09745 [Acidobacteria bacterium]|nr:hypothetical protein [Acidobacteriota bacterium]